MDDSSPARVVSLDHAAAGLAYLVAGIHLFHPTHGFSRLALLVSTDPGLLLSTPRPAAFVLSGLAIVVGVPAVALGVPRKPVYALGILLMVTYLGGYFAWHFSGHGGFLPGREPLYHGLSPVENVVTHLTGDPWAVAAVVAETALLVALVALFRRDARSGTDRTRSGGARLR